MKDSWLSQLMTKRKCAENVNNSQFRASMLENSNPRSKIRLDLKRENLSIDRFKSQVDNRIVVESWRESSSSSERNCCLIKIVLLVNIRRSHHIDSTMSMKDPSVDVSNGCGREEIEKIFSSSKTVKILMVLFMSLHQSHLSLGEIAHESDDDRLHSMIDNSIGESLFIVFEDENVLRKQLLFSEISFSSFERQSFSCRAFSRNSSIGRRQSSSHQQLRKSFFSRLNSLSLKSSQKTSLSFHQHSTSITNHRHSSFVE
jgi:hypothetical protein